MKVVADSGHHGIVRIIACVGALLLSALMVGSPLALAVPTGDGDKPAKEDKKKTESERPDKPKRTMPTLAFTDDAAAKAFESGWKLFGESKWKDADEQFDLALASADDNGRDVIKGYHDACKAGPKADKIGESIGKGKWRSAWKQLLRLEKREGDTPLNEVLAVYRIEIEDYLFYVIDDFEDEATTRRNGEPVVKKDGGDKKADPGRDWRRLITQDGNTAINKNKDYVEQGEASLRWRARPAAKIAGFTANNRDPSARIAVFDPEVIRQYRYLWVSVLDEEPATMAFAWDVGEQADPVGAGGLRGVTLRQGGGNNDYVFHSFKARRGWNQIRIDLKSSAARKALAKAGEVFGIRAVNVKPGGRRNVYFDEIKFERE